MVGNFNPSLANEAPSALSSSSCSAQLGMMLATYFLLFFCSLATEWCWFEPVEPQCPGWLVILIHPLVISTADFLTHVVQWVFQTLPQTLILSPSGPQHPIYSVDSYCTDEDLLHQVHSPSISFFPIAKVSIYPSSLFLACFRGGCTLRFLLC